MRMVGVTESFVSRWSANPVGWLIVLLPTMAIVALQEGNTPHFGPIPIVASAITQHVISGAIAILVILVLKRALSSIPVTAIVAVWVLTGALRGLVGGAFAMWIAGEAPNFAERILAWVVITVVWMPLISYLFAQLELRRTLQRSTELIESQLAEEHRRSRLSAAQLQAEVVTTVRDAVSPLVEEVRASLVSVAEQGSEAPLESISERLESIAARTETIIGARGHEIDAADAGTPAMSWAAYGGSLSFDRSQPLLTAVLSGFAIAAIYLPAAFHSDGLIGFTHEFLSLIAGTGATFLLLLIIKLIRLTERFTITATIAAFTLGGLAALVMFLLITGYSLDPRQVLVAISLPGMFITAGVLLCSAIGVGGRNAYVVPRINALDEELQDLRRSTRERDARVANQVNQLMHGPILGRLSACVMALNFFLAEPPSDNRARRLATMEGVIAHLELISEDFEELGLSPQ